MYRFLFHFGSVIIEYFLRVRFVEIFSSMGRIIINYSSNSCTTRFDTVMKTKNNRTVLNYKPLINYNNTLWLTYNWPMSIIVYCTHIIIYYNIYGEFKINGIKIVHTYTKQLRIRNDL